MSTSQIIVRPARKSDLPSVEKHYNGPMDTLGDPFCDTIKIQGTRLDWLLIGEIDGEYAGFLYWHLGEKPFFKPEIRKFAHIRELQVLEMFRGRGLGRRLVTEALEQLRKEGVEEVVLSTVESNSVAREMYGRLGFREFRKQIYYSRKISD